jgi:hypothetical protein
MHVVNRRWLLGGRAVVALGLACGVWAYGVGAYVVYEVSVCVHSARSVRKWAHSSSWAACRLLAFAIRKGSVALV